ncbi:class I tRNA ligase family protein [Mycoplasmopsis adleri]|uniref:class I tRNA ligase family protein n=1 Tax=Mycoplasmopsis adleri TaxID=51362 RepID=UPI003872B924
MLKIYLCGPTVYNSPHIGNMRAVITYDIMLKSRRILGEKFCFVHNITDVDDKIINRAIQENKTEKDISNFYTEEYFNLLKNLDVDTITHIEKVTENMDVIINYIKKLVDSKNAYVDNEGNVWFDVAKNRDAYGMVSNQKLENMIFEEQSTSKKYEADFALWKQTTKGIKFDSIFGKGRPGWHTECCALINKHFGSDGVDLHGGGMDLTFPHHENENIQHYSLFKKPLVKEWLRCGQINLDGVKMSKSLGNVILAKDFLKTYSPTVLKLIFTNTKLTANINITEDMLNNMIQLENKFQKLIFKFFTTFKNINLIDVKSEQVVKMLEAISNGNFSDYNFILNEEIKQFNKTKSLENAKNIFSILNVIHPELTRFTRYEEALSQFDEWRCLVDKKDYLEADKIRKILMEKNFY